MNVNELIEKLSAFTEEQRQYPVCVHDGSDPSDLMEATHLEVGKMWCEDKLAVHILS